MDWGGLAVVWWLVVMVWARLRVGGLVFVDDTVARRGAYGVRGVNRCRGGRRGGRSVNGSRCWLNVACMSVVRVMLGVAAQGCL